MPIQIETLSLISAVQALLLAAMLWAGTHGDPGRTRSSLRVRACALALEGCGWGMVAARAYVPALLVTLGGNALNLLAQAMGVLALRMLLGVPLRWRLVAAVNVAGWLVMAWFTAVHPSYPMRFTFGSVAFLINIALSLEALFGQGRRHLTRARGVLAVYFLCSLALLVWRNGALWLAAAPPAYVGTPVSSNFIYVVLGGLQPFFSSIGFLLLYSEILQQELHILARVDPLTGVSNRLALDEVASRLMRQTSLQHQPLCVLMLDADHFKSVNDRYGHGGGDEALMALVECIRGRLRSSDVVGRIGGEEFVVLSPGADLGGAIALAERIRATVESTPLRVQGGQLRLTVSIGVAVAHPGETVADAVLRRADDALYAAKRGGRNRVMAEGRTDAPLLLQSA